MTISKAEGIKLDKLAKTITDIMRRDSTFVDLLKKVVNFADAFVKEEIKKFVAGPTMYIVKDMMSPDSQTVASTDSYYRYIWMSKPILRHKGFLDLMGGLNSDDAVSKRLDTNKLDGVGLYRTTPEELEIFIRVVRHLVKNRNKPARFNVPTLYTKAK